MTVKTIYALCGLMHMVWVRVVPRRTVVGDTDRRFDNLSGSHHQISVSRSDSSVVFSLLRVSNPVTTRVGKS